MFCPIFSDIFPPSGQSMNLVQGLDSSVIHPVLRGLANTGEGRSDLS